MVQARADFEFTLNGKSVPVRNEPPQTTLLDFIRARGLTGAKEGCAEGECGACAVLMVAPGASSATYRALNSCLMPLPSAAHQEIYTVEALARSASLAEVQRAMAERGGSQCGYCTPGFVVSMFAAQHQGARDVHALGGNLCRCTGYRPIRDALQSLGAPCEGVLTERLAQPAPHVPALRYKANEGQYSRPTTLAECFAITGEDPSARFVAGNTDLGVLTNLHDERFAHLIALDAVLELRDFSESEGAVEIGAALTLTEIAERWANPPAAFHDWLELFASVLIRNRATLGGNLGTASPIGDSAPFLFALDARVRIAGPTIERMVPLTDFFRAYHQTALGAGEVIRSIRIPKPFPQFLRFYKVAKRRLDDISTVAAGISMNRDATGKVSRVRFGFGGVAATPVRATAAERAIENTQFGPKDLERASAEIIRTIHPIDDHRGSAAFRLAMAQSLIAKFRHEVQV